MASDSRDLVKRDGVDPQDEPSAEWGWHGGFPIGTVAGGVLTIILCIGFLFGPYQSRTQDLWLIGTVVIIIVGIVVQIRRKRNAWRR